MTTIESREWLQKMSEEGFLTVSFQRAFQLSLGGDEVAKERRNTFTVSLSIDRCVLELKE